MTEEKQESVKEMKAEKVAGLDVGVGKFSAASK